MKNVSGEGSLAGSISRACDSWSQDCEFEPHVGHGDYFEKKKKKRNVSTMELDPGWKIL